jgi:tetratricopeptide (TPR) repeat protein
MDKAQFYNLEALKLDNDSVQFLENLAFCSFDSGNSEKAIEILKKDYVKDTNYINTVNYLGYGYMFLGQHKESLKYYLKYSAILETHGQISTNNMHRIGYAYFKNGYKKEAEFYFKKQIEYCENIIKLGRRSVAAQEPFYTYYDLAGVYAFRGDKNKAYKNLNNFNQIQRIPLWMVTLIKNDPLFDNIRNEPEFQQIVKDVETKYQAEHERVKKWLEEQGML